MLRSCSPLSFFFALVVTFMVPMGITYWGLARVHRKSTSDFDRDTWLLISLCIAAIAITGLYIIFVFFQTVGC